MMPHSSLRKAKWRRLDRVFHDQSCSQTKHIFFITATIIGMLTAAAVKVDKIIESAGYKIPQS